MKRRFATTAAVLLVAACGGSAPSAKAPLATLPSAASPPRPVIAPPTDADEVTEGAVTVAWAHGMEILVKRTPGAEFAAARLVIRGGARDWTRDDAGIEDVALGVATSGGTKSLPKTPYSLKLASLGATIDGGAVDDYSFINAKAPVAAWEELFPIFAETFLAPALPTSEIEVARQRQLTWLRHESEDGDGRLNLLVRKSQFAGHPYENRAAGTVQTIERLKADELAPHLQRLRDTNRLVLVIVGDLDPAHAIAQARSMFASVPRGSYVESPMPPLKFDGAHLATDTFKLPTNYIQTTFAGPQWQDADFGTLRVAMSLLGDRMFDEVRTKRNLSYAPAAWMDWRLGAPYSRLSVTAVDPTTTMTVMLDQVRKLQNELVPQTELDGAKGTYLTLNEQWEETSDWQAFALAQALALGGDWHLVPKFHDQIRAVTPADVQRVARRWLVNPQTAIVGDPTKLDPKVVGAP